MLTKYLGAVPNIKLVLVEIDDRIMDQLKEKFDPITSNIIHADILELDLGKVFDGQPFSIIGNFPFVAESDVDAPIERKASDVVSRAAAYPGRKNSNLDQRQWTNVTNGTR